MRPSVSVPAVEIADRARIEDRHRRRRSEALNVPSPPAPPAETHVCYRHPDRAAHLRCTRCDRHICADCTRDATAGHRCVECVQAGAGTVRQPRWRFGAWQRSGRPMVTYTLIASNVLAFVGQTPLGGLERDLVLWSPAVADGQLYRLVTSAFLHYGVLHLLVNMWALYVVGPALESLLGRLRFGALYGLSALGGSVAVYLLVPMNVATAGASGAVFGLFGAAFVTARRLQLDVGWMAAVIIINLIFTFSIPNISWQDHVGGLITGVLIALAYVYAPLERRNLFQAAATLLALAFLVALVWWRTADLMVQLGLS